MIDRKSLSLVLKAVAEVMKAALSVRDDRLEQLERSLKEIPAGPRGERGERGEKGEKGDSIPGPAPDAEFLRKLVYDEIGKIPLPKDGKDADPVDVDAIRRDVLSQIPKPKDGQDGKDADIEAIRRQIASEVQKSVAAIPPAKDGKDANPVDTAAIIADVLKQIPTPKDGKDADRDAIRDFIVAEVRASVQAIPPAKDGKPGKDAEPIHPDTIALMVVQEVQKAVTSLPKPVDGRPGDRGSDGRDALEIDILPAINPQKSYPRGTWAQHDNGLIKSLRQTTASESLDWSEWNVVVPGSGPLDMEQSADDPRVFTFKEVRTGGQVFTKSFRIPFTIYRGVFRTTEKYMRGDQVTCAGSTWNCWVDNPTSTPGSDSKEWQLAVKAGRDGKNGEKGTPGEPGKPGRDGKDFKF